jgi:hypothetical protein
MFSDFDRGAASPFFFSELFRFSCEPKFVRSRPTMHEVVTVSAKACQVVVIKALVPALLDLFDMMHTDGSSDVSVSRSQLHACPHSFFQSGHTHLALIAIALQDLLTLCLPLCAFIKLLIFIHNNSITMQLKSLTFWLSGFT